MKLLLDTNAYTALIKGQEKVVKKVRQAEHIYLSAIVIGELLFGFRNGTKFEQNYALLQTFLTNPYISTVNVNETTADRFARIATQLKKQGTPIPTNDVWIAAHTLETGADLITFDKHFNQIEGLVIVTL